MHHNINMFTTGNTHLKYRKHRVHSAAHKLKIRSSRLVLTTAGTDLDSTDRAAIGGAKNSSASEPLKRPILSLWNSREKQVEARAKQFRCSVSHQMLYMSHARSKNYKLLLPAPWVDRSQSMSAGYRIQDHSISVWINQLSLWFFQVRLHLKSNCVSMAQWSI